MNLPARILIGSLALTGALAIVIGVAMYSESSNKSHFSTYKQLAASGLFAKGWLPDFLPHSISDISESHDLDSNRVWATFKYDTNDISNIENNCKLLLASEKGSKYVCPPYEKQLTTLILMRNGEGSLETEPDEF